MAPNRNPAARLYAHVEVQHRPQETPPVEQGQAVVLSNIFSPPGQAGIGTWCRCLVYLYCGMWFRLFYLFTLHCYLLLFFAGRDDSARHGTTFQACHSEAKPKNPFPRPLRSTSPTKWVVLREDEQGSEVRFRRQAETKQSGLCEDDKGG